MFEIEYTFNFFVTLTILIGLTISCIVYGWTKTFAVITLFGIIYIIIFIMVMIHVQHEDYENKRHCSRNYKFEWTSDYLSRVIISSFVLSIISVIYVVKHCDDDDKLQ